MSGRTEKLMLDAPLSPALQSLFERLDAADWAARVPSCVFIRDFEMLPRSAPFDIDVVCASSEWPQLRELVRECAGEVLISENEAGQALYILAIEVEGPAEARRHAFFEVRSVLRVPAKQFAVPPAADIDVPPGDIVREAGNGLPRPAPVWHAGFTLLQALRKPDVDKYMLRFNAFDTETRKSAQNLLASLFRFPADELDRWRTSPTPRLRQASKESAPQEDGRERLRRFWADRLFFLPLLNLDFFTIHGPDGAGKSTTCAEIARLFEGLPFGLHQFHHSEGWKEGRRRDPGTGQRTRPRTTVAATADEPSFARRAARAVYRILPRAVREFWLWNSHFVNYNRKFTRFLLDKRNSGYILFADRYIYDVRIKYIVETGKPSWLVRAYYRLHCALVPRPRFGFVLVDDPARIVARKDELTEEQVTRFIDWIMRILRQRRIPHTVVPIDGRPPRAVAVQIARELLARQGPDLIAHMRTFVTRQEITDAQSPEEPAPLRAAV